MRTVSLTKNDLPIIVVGGGSRSRLAVPPGHVLYSRLGAFVRVRVGRKRLNPQIVSLPEGRAAQLELGPGTPWPRGKSFRLWLREDGAGGWHVGPIIGILAHVFRGPRYGPQDTLFQRMITEAESLGGLAFVLSAGSSDLSRGRIRGYRHDGRAWRGSYFPLPDVMYNRTQATPATRRLESGLRRVGRVRIFNNRLGSKWRQYRILVRDPQAVPYLPVTRMLRRAEDLYSVVARFGGAYVKPSRGGFGKGIWRIERHPRGYEVRRTDGNGRSHRLGILSLAQAYRAIRQSGRRYIVQQRLHLIRWRGSIADVRVLIQKNIRGQWGITGAGVRVGQGGTIVSNLSGGGRAHALHEVVSELFADDPDLAAEIQRLVPVLAMRLATRLERSAPPLGELGIDLGIDRSGRVWFLEANSRTGRSLFHQIDRDESGRHADRRPMEYAVFLAGFRPEPSGLADHSLRERIHSPSRPSTGTTATNG